MALRERVLAAVGAGTSRPEIVRRRRVSLATLGRYVRLRREGRSLEGKRPAGRRLRSSANRSGRPWQGNFAAVGTDASLEEHCELWHARQGGRVSVQTMRAGRWHAWQAGHTTHTKRA